MSKTVIWLLRIFTSIVGAIISLFIAHYFNPFVLMSFIPTSSVYDVCITVYFSITELLINWGLDKAKEKAADYYSDIKIVLSHSDEQADLNSQPMIRFNECDMAEIAITIVAKGSLKRLSNIRVIIPRIAQADYQPGRKSLGASINDKGDFCVDLSVICGHQEKVMLSETFLITLQRAPVDNNASVIITPTLSPRKNKRVRFQKNTASLQMEVR